MNREATIRIGKDRILIINLLKEHLGEGRQVALLSLQIDKIAIGIHPSYIDRIENSPESYIQA